MGGMRVAYEDDIPKNRGPKVPGGALDSEVGWGNTFAPYCSTVKDGENAYFFPLVVCEADRLRAWGYDAYGPPMHRPSGSCRRLQACPSLHDEPEKEKSK